MNVNIFFLYYFYYYIISFQIHYILMKLSFQNREKNISLTSSQYVTQNYMLTKQGKSQFSLKTDIVRTSRCYLTLCSGITSNEILGAWVLNWSWLYARQALTPKLSFVFLTFRFLSCLETFTES